MTWEPAPDIKKRILTILNSSLFPHVKPHMITVLRGHGSSSRAIARIWSLPKPWQLALSIEPQYIIEVITERFDRLSFEDQDRTLIHELMHIPKTFSGALVAHHGRSHRIDRRTVEVIYQHYRQNQSP